MSNLIGANTSVKPRPKITNMESNYTKTSCENLLLSTTKANLSFLAKIMITIKMKMTIKKNDKAMNAPSIPIKNVLAPPIRRLH